MPDRRNPGTTTDIIRGILRRLYRLERVVPKGVDAVVSVIQHALAGPSHTATGLTVGQVVRAIGSSSFAWQKLLHGDLDPASVGANDHHAQSHGRTDHTTAVALLDEGAAQGDVLELDFTGAGVTATRAGVRATVNIPGGGGGGGTGSPGFAFFMG